MKERTRKAEAPLNSIGYGYRSTLENGPYLLDQIDYSEPIENFRYQYCGACAFYNNGNCIVLNAPVDILASCRLYIPMITELDLRHQSFLLRYYELRRREEAGEKSDDLEIEEVVEKYISEEDGKFCVRSHQTGKSFGCYSTRAAAEKRLKQIKRFKKSTDADDYVEKEFVIKFTEIRDEEQQIVYGIVLEPDEVDTQEDTITATQIERAAHKYALKPMIVGDGHKKKAKAQPVETFIKNSKLLETVKEGSWVMAVQVEDEELWKGVKEGSYTGFSIGARVKRIPLEPEEEE